MAVEDCGTCNGKGWVYVDTPFGGERVTCDDCGGSGH